jgi:hypothetical protein
MKHTVTDLNDPNEPIIFSNSTLGNFCINSFFGNFPVESSPFIELGLHYEILHCIQVTEYDCLKLENVDLVKRK